MTDEHELTAIESLVDAIDKHRKVDLLIAHSPEWDEEHREDLMASADKIVDTNLKNTPGVAAKVDAEGAYDTGVEF